MTLTAVGASVCASGSHVCSGHTGSLTAKPTNSRVNTTPDGTIRVAAWIFSGSSVMSKVPTPVEKKSASIPTSMNALPRKVKIRNFIAEYSRRPLPQMEIRKNMGTSSSSHRRKNRMKSSAVKTPITAVWRMSSHTKYSRTRSLIPHDAKMAVMPRRPASSTIGALSPSTPRKYCTSKLSTAIQSVTLSMCW